MNESLKRAARNTIARILTIALRVIPSGRHVFVHGSPGTEGNAVETVRALLSETSVTVAWPEAPTDTWLTANGIDTSRVERLGNVWSIGAIWRFLRASAVFHTHGVYGAPTPAPRQPIVNLWHGDSFKGGQIFPHRTLRGPSSTFLVTSSALIGEIKASRAGVSTSQLLTLGLPRADQLHSPASDRQLLSLGIDPSRPFVLWMPTFRTARTKHGGIAWSNTANPDSDAALSSHIELIASRFRAAGITIVSKAHPLDAVSRRADGIAAIDDETLSRANVPLYSLLGRSAGLISDYSSVWIDYLTLNRPIGFLMTDLEDYAISRPITAGSLLTEFPGPQLDSPEGAERFVADVLTNGANGQPERDRFKTVIGYVSNKNNAIRVVRASLGATTLLRARSDVDGAPR